MKRSLMEVGFGAVSRTAQWVPIEHGNAEIDLLAQYAGRAADLGEWMEGAQINRDRNLRLQYLAGMSVNSYHATDILQGILEYYKFPAIYVYVNIKIPQNKANDENSCNLILTSPVILSNQFNNS